MPSNLKSAHSCSHVKTRVCEFINECNRFYPGRTKKQRDISIGYPIYAFLSTSTHCTHPLSDCAHPLPNCAQPLPNRTHPLSNFTLYPFLHTVIMPKWYESSSYVDLFTIPEFTQCREVFLRVG
jgi:hypothetical protein